MDKGYIGDIFQVMFVLVLGVMFIVATYYAYSNVFDSIKPVIGSSVDVDGIKGMYTSAAATGMFMLFLVVVYYIVRSYELASLVQFTPSQIVLYVLLIPSVVIAAHYLIVLFNLFTTQTELTSSVNTFGSLINFVSDYLVELMVFFAGLLGYGMYRSKV